MSQATTELPAKSPRDSPWPVRPELVVAALTALAVVVAVPMLSSRSLWLDESVSVMLARLDRSSFLDTVVNREGNMSLYATLTRAWVGLGDSEAVFRSLSVVAAAATVPVTFAIGRRLFDDRVGVIAALFTVVNGMFAQYTAEARGYALVMLLVTVASYLLLRAEEKDSGLRWALYAAVAALAVFAHYFALLVIAAHAVYLALVPRRVCWRNLAIAGVTGAAILSPLLILIPGGQSSGLEWTNDTAPGRLIEQVQDVIPKPLGAAVFAAAILALWVIQRRRRLIPIRDPKARPVVFVVAWLLVPLALTGLVSYFLQPLIVVRYLIVCLPAAALLGAYLVTRLESPRRVAAATIGVAVLLLGTVGVWYHGGETENWRDAVEVVATSAEPNDGIVFFAPYVRTPFEYYLDDDLAEVLQPVFPASGWGESPEEIVEYIPVDESVLAADAAAFDRLWLVLSHEFVSDADQDLAAVNRALDDFVEVERDSFDGVTVTRLERTSGG